MSEGLFCCKINKTKYDIVKNIKTFEEFIGDLDVDKLRNVAAKIQQKDGDKDSTDLEVTPPADDTGDGDMDPNS